MVKNSETASVKREFERDTISLDDLFQKFQKKDIDYKIYLVRESQYRENEIFEIVGILGSGRSCYVFLALIDKKLVSLRMSYEKSDFKDKFDSVRVEMEDGYDEYFLNILYPSVPIDYICLGSVKKKNKLFFDEKVYASFWEKADSTLTIKLDSSLEKKVKWFSEFLKGLRIIHSRKRAHFDIKLDNLFLVGNHLKIGDFEYYLKIEDFINSKIFYCGTPGHIAPEMFLEKRKVSEKIDIFSAGVTFAKLFTGILSTQEPGASIEGDITLTPEEEKEFKSLFKEDSLLRLPSRKIQNAFLNNFRIFTFFKNALKKELEKKELSEELKKIYQLLLNMMNTDPKSRPDIDTVILKMDSAMGKVVPVVTKLNDKNIDVPVFRIGKFPVVIINLNKKSSIEIGSIKRKEHPSDVNYNDIYLRFVDISRQHIKISYISDLASPGEDRVEICDLMSKHGVFIDNQRLDAGRATKLSNGDIVQVGNIISFKFTEEDGYYLFKHITHDRKGGNLLWLDKNQLNELPDRQASIVLMKRSIKLSPFGVEENAMLILDDKNNIEFVGSHANTPVSGDIIL